MGKLSFEELSKAIVSSDPAHLMRALISVGYLLDGDLGSAEGLQDRGDMDAAERGLLALRRQLAQRLCEVAWEDWGAWLEGTDSDSRYVAAFITGYQTAHPNDPPILNPLAAMVAMVRAVGEEMTRRGTSALRDEMMTHWTAPLSTEELIGQLSPPSQEALNWLKQFYPEQIYGLRQAVLDVLPQEELNSQILAGFWPVN